MISLENWLIEKTGYYKHYIVNWVIKSHIPYDGSMENGCPFNQRVILHPYHDLGEKK